MKKVFCIYVLFVLLFSCCAKKSTTASDSNETEEAKKEEIIRTEPETKTIKVNPYKTVPDFFITLKYKTSGILTYNKLYDKYESLLEEILYFYEDESGMYYLGKVDRTGVYDKDGNSLFLTAKSYVKDGYPSDIILEYPAHIEYFWFEYDEKYIYKYPGEIHVTFEPVINISFDLENMTLKKLIPNI